MKIVKVLLISIFLFGCQQNSEQNAAQKVIESYGENSRVSETADGYEVEIIAPNFAQLTKPEAFESIDDMSEKEIKQWIEDSQLDSTAYRFHVNNNDTEEIKREFFNKVAYEIYAETIGRLTFEGGLLDDAQDSD